MAGGPIVVLAATGQVQLLAEVASFLHLIMYGLMCVALVSIRRDRPEWYDPDFRVPGGPVIPVLARARQLRADRVHESALDRRRDRGHRRNGRVVLLLCPRRGTQGAL